MKPPLATAVLALVVLHPALAEQAAVAHRAALRESFRYDPVARPAAPAAVPAMEIEEQVVVLERLTIVESITQRDLAKQIEQRWADEAGRQFSWQKGGVLVSQQIGKAQVEIGAWPLSATGIRLELVRIRW